MWGVFAKATDTIKTTRIEKESRNQLDCSSFCIDIKFFQITAKGGVLSKYTSENLDIGFHLLQKAILFGR